MTDLTRQEFWWRTFVTATVLFGFGIGYWLIDANSTADAEREAARQEQAVADALAYSDRMCEEISSTRRALLDITFLFAVDSPVPEDASAELRSTIERANERRAEVRAASEAIASPPLCADGQPPESALP